MCPIFNRYNWSSLNKAIRNPQLFVEELTNIGTHVGAQAETRFRKWNFHRRFGEGVDIMSEEWDNLLILDGCRYDIFEEKNTIDGDLDHIISKGSHSEEFYKKNFYGREYHDTIAITANPYTPIVCNGVFYDIKTTFSGEEMIGKEPRIEKVKDKNGRIIEASHIENVHPEKLNQLAIQIHQQYPNKRLIIHYMQPHAPYLGRHAKKIRDSLREEGIEFKYWSNLNEADDDSDTTANLLSLAMEGLVSKEELECIYKENVDIVLGHVKEVLPKLNGKTVITSDHGELLGNRIVLDKNIGWQRLGHNPNHYVRELRKVPWLSIEDESSREIIEESPKSNDSADTEDLSEHLELLGYK